MEITMDKICFGEDTVYGVEGADSAPSKYCINFLRQEGYMNILRK